MKASSLRRTRQGAGLRHGSPERGLAHPVPPGDRWRALAGFMVGLLLLVSAVVVDSAASDSFRLPKLLLAETLGLASLVPLWLGALTSAEERPRWRTTALLAAAPLLLAAILSAVASPHPEAARAGLSHACVGFACWIGWSSALGRHRLRRLLDVLLLPAALLAAIALLQATGRFQPLQLLVPLGARFEMISLAGNVGDLAMYLALPTLVALAGLLEHRGWRRVAFGLILALFATTLLVARTITVLIAVALGGVVLGALRLDRRRFVGLVVILCLVALLGGLFVPGLGERLRMNAEALAAGELNIVLSGRLDGWQAAIWMLRQHPLTGVGVGAFATEFSPARLALWKAPHDAGPQPYYGSFDTAHNDYLQLAAEQGASGVMALLAAAGIAVAALRTRRSVTGGDRALGGAGVATLAVVAFGDFPFQLALTAYPALLFLAWLLAEGETVSPAR